MSHKSSRHRKIAFETLEHRELMAGDVSVKFTGSGSSRSVKITGDNSANSIQITQPTLDNYRVSGLSGTKINGSTGGVFNFNIDSFGSKGDLTIDMKNDDDYVAILGGAAEYFDIDIEDDLIINMGSGNDTVSLNYVEADDVTIDLGKGTDTVFLQGLYVSDDLTIKAPSSSTAAKRIFAVDNTVVDKFSITTRAGEDTVDILRTRAARWAIDLGSDDDRLNIRRSNVGSSGTINGGKGTDDLNLYLNTGKTLKRSNFKAPTAIDINYSI